MLFCRDESRAYARTAADHTMTNCSELANSDIPTIMRQLVLRVKEVVQKGVSDGTLRPEDEMYFRLVPRDFKYTNTGVVVTSAYGEEITRQSWNGPSLRVEQTTRESAEYKSALTQLKRFLPEGNEAYLALNRFLFKVAYCILSQPVSTESDVGGLVTTFIRNLLKEPVRYDTEVELEGVVLGPEKLELKPGVVLRRTRLEDVQKEFPIHGGGSREMPRPSSVMNLTFLTTNGAETRGKVETAVAILRLFRVGAVTWTSCRIQSDSITDPYASSEIRRGKMSEVLRTYLIEEKDADAIRAFWRELSGSILVPMIQLPEAKPSYLSTAYERYCDALLGDHALERSIAWAIMGLESLFLGDSETQELAYRLSRRVAKLLGLLGRDPVQVRDSVNHAYHIRSQFLHGGRLDREDEKVPLPEASHAAQVLQDEVGGGECPDWLHREDDGAQDLNIS